MIKDRHSAIKLRKQNKSYNEISRKLGIPKSTLTYWFSDKDWSAGIKKTLIKKATKLSRKRLILMNAARKEKWERWRQEFRNQAKKEFKRLKKNPLFVAGLMLYWGEGDSKIENSLVRLTNTDPEMIKSFIEFLLKVCCVPVEKIRISITLYPDLKEKECKNFWIEALSIPESQFFKTQYIHGRHPTRRLLYGICSLVVCSRGLKEKIFTWLSLYKKELINS